MGISLSNKDYIAFTIKKKRKKGKKRHDYDAIADYNKTIVKSREKERERDETNRKEKRKWRERFSLMRPPSIARKKKRAECRRTGCVYAVRTLITRLDRYYI